MATTLLPSESRESRRERVDGRWASAGWRGVHDGVDDLTSGPNAGVRSPNVAETLPAVGHVDGDDVHSEFALLTHRASLALIIFQPVAN